MDYINPLEYLSFDPRIEYDVFNASKRANYNPNWQVPGDPAGHEGNDLYNVLDFPIRAAKAGWCHASGFLNSGAGYGVEIFSPDEDEPLDGEGHRYLHMPKGGPIPRKGDWIDQGQVIGRIGLTGMTRSPHLHWGTGYIEGYRSNRSILAQWKSFPPESTGYLDKEPEVPPVPGTAVLCFWPSLMQGDGYNDNPMYRPLVKRMQSCLAIEGFIEYGPNFSGDGEPDGKFGPSTRAAMLSFQRAYDLPEDAVCDMDDWIPLTGAIT